MTLRACIYPTQMNTVQKILKGIDKSYSKLINSQNLVTQFHWRMKTIKQKKIRLKTSWISQEGHQI